VSFVGGVLTVFYFYEFHQICILSALHLGTKINWLHFEVRGQWL